MYQDPQRQIVVLWLAGKYGELTRKLTDTLYLMLDGLEAGRDVSPLLLVVTARLEAMYVALHCYGCLLKLLNTICVVIATVYSRDYLVRCGEFLTAHLMALYLGYTSVELLDLLFFDVNGAIDEAKTLAAYRRLPRVVGIVVSGSYGQKLLGVVQLLARGGSDILGLWLARLAVADLYENWTDVLGM